MKIIEASYGASFEGIGQWEKMLLKVELSEGDDVQESLDYMKKEIQKFREASAVDSMTGVHEKVIQLEPKQKMTPKEVLVGEINACTSVTMLEQNKLLATNYGLMDEYNQKLKSLTV